MSWRDGAKAALKEYREYKGDAEELPMVLMLALLLFKLDPPDTPYQLGYEAGVRRMARNAEAAFDAHYAASREMDC